MARKPQHVVPTHAVKEINLASSLASTTMTSDINDVICSDDRHYEVISGAQFVMLVLPGSRRNTRMNGPLARLPGTMAMVTALNS